MVDVSYVDLAEFRRCFERLRPPVAEHDLRRFACPRHAAVDGAVELHVRQQLRDQGRLNAAGRVQADAMGVRHPRAVGVQVLDRAVAQQVNSAPTTGSGQRRHGWFRSVLARRERATEMYTATRSSYQRRTGLAAGGGAPQP